MPRYTKVTFIVISIYLSPVPCLGVMRPVRDERTWLPVSNNTGNNKTISYEITNKNKSTNDGNNVVIRFSLIIRKTTKSVLPYSPNFFSQFVEPLMQLVLTQQKLNQVGSCERYVHA